MRIVLLALLFPGSIHAQEAAVPFDAPQVQLPLESAAFQRLFDYDGDGDLDAVGGRVRVSSGKVTGYENRVWTNDGSGAFELGLLELVESAPRGASIASLPLAVGDFDGDGRDDFVQAAGAELWRYRSPGLAGVAFEKSVSFLGVPLLDLEVADFDGDGRDDVALLTAGRVAIQWSGDRRLRGSVLPLPFANHMKLVVCETDGDPLPDLLAVGGKAWTALALEGRRLRSLQSQAFSQAGPMVDAGDVDGDGDEDIAAFYHATVEVFLRVGPTTWKLQPEYAGGPAEYLADIDGDGDDDGVCCSGGGGGSGGGTWPSLDFASDFEITLNDKGRFEPAFPIPGMGSRSLAGARDVDGDGDVDLVAGRCVYFQRGPWEPRAQPGLDWSWGESDLADLDGDGDEDATRDTWFHAFDGQAYWNLGDGRFEWSALDMDPPPGGTTVGSPRLNGDFDADGDIDLILGVQSPSSGSALHFGLWRNTESGTFRYAGAAFAPGTGYPGTFVHSESFLAGDLQADGDLDVVFVYQSTSYQTYVYLNGGSGSFTLDANYVQEGATELVDLDQDGLLDLLLHAGVRYGRASGLPFGGRNYEYRFYHGSGDPNDLLVRDFNDDGYPDALLLRVGLYPIPTVLLNGLPLGSGRNFVVGWQPATWPIETTRVQALDVDLDGRQDLLLGPYATTVGPRRVYRFYRGSPSAPATLGPEAFALESEFVFEPPGNVYGVRQSRLLCLDVDGDGDRDPIGRTLLRNTSVGP